MAFGADNNLYVTNFGGGNILRTNGTTNTFFTDAALGILLRPLVFGPDGNLYVGDYGNGSVLLFDGTTGAFIDTFVAAGGLLGGPTFLVFNGSAPAIPISGSLLLLGSGLVGLGGLRLREKFKRG